MPRSWYCNLRHRPPVRTPRPHLRHHPPKKTKKGRSEDQPFEAGNKQNRMAIRCETQRLPFFCLVGLICVLRGRVILEPASRPGALSERVPAFFFRYFAAPVSSHHFCEVFNRIQ
jgi:hypothetical protein